MGREQTVNRISFTNEVKQRILAKSDCRCCHCGKKLALNKATVEHFIPISKGGTNLEANLVALCYGCNKNKNNYIMNPLDYYKYLKADAMKDLVILYDCYNQDKSWLTTKNYIKEDAVEIKYPVMIPSMQGHKLKNRKNLSCINELYVTAVLKKATYDDLNDILEFLKNYHDKYGLERDYLKDVVSDVFGLGAFYMLYKQNELIAVIPITMDIVEIKGEKGYIPVVKGFPCMRLTQSNISITERVFAYLFGNIASINPKGNCMFQIHVPKADKILYGHFDERCMMYTQEDEWAGFIIDIQATDDGMFAYRNSNDYAKEFKSTSDFLQKTMKLKTLKEESTQANPKKQKYVRQEKHKKRFDDYDGYEEYEA